jgi:pyruvate formate lyase activating enzyme
MVGQDTDWLRRTCGHAGAGEPYKLSRRSFLRGVGLAAVAGAARPEAWAGAPDAEPQEARFYERLESGRIRCNLCPWHCVVEDGKRGHCEVRENRKGRYYSLVYGRPCTLHVDPIEKKPFFHVYPGSKAFSIATVGCNFDCKFCQNWDISQARPEDMPVAYRSPQDIAQAARHEKTRTVAYTYSEPTIFCEYMLDCSRAARDLGIGNVVVSNGFIEQAPLKELCSVVTAVKVDFKAFSQPFYGNVCSGRLQPVLETLKRLAGSGVWYEMVVLIVPTLNDDMDDIKRMAAWITKELGPDVPLHFTRFHPCYKITNLPQTPTQTLERARDIAMKEGCHFVYGGNVPGMRGENTYCPHCGACVVNRYGLLTLSMDLRSGCCGKCGAKIPGVWA